MGQGFYYLYVCDCKNKFLDYVFFRENFLINIHMFWYVKTEKKNYTYYVPI